MDLYTWMDRNESIPINWAELIRSMELLLLVGTMSCGFYCLPTNVFGAPKPHLQWLLWLMQFAGQFHQWFTFKIVQKCSTYFKIFRHCLERDVLDCISIYYHIWYIMVWCFKMCSIIFDPFHLWLRASGNFHLGGGRFGVRCLASIRGLQPFFSTRCLECSLSTLLVLIRLLFFEIVGGHGAHGFLKCLWLRLRLETWIHFRTMEFERKGRDA